MKTRIYMIVTVLAIFSGLCFYCGGIDWLILSGFLSIGIFIISTVIILLLPKKHPSFICRMCDKKYAKNSLHSGVKKYKKIWTITCPSCYHLNHFHIIK